MAESFFASLKTQLTHHVKFRDKLEAEHSLFNYIEVYFNRQRKHSTNSYKAPALYEQEWWNREKRLNLGSTVVLQNQQLDLMPGIVYLRT